MDQAPTTALFRGLLRRHRNRMEVARMDIAERTTAAVLRSAPDPTAPYAPADRRRALRAIDQVLDEYYGAFPHDERAAFLWITVEDARTAMVAAYDFAVGQLERALRRR